MAKNKGLIIVLVIINVALGAWLIWNKKSEKRIGYILIKDVFEGFDMKKEMEAKYKHTQGTRAKILDSLAFELKLMDKQLQSKGKEVLKEEIDRLRIREEEFIARKKQFTQDDAIMTQQFDKQILDQLNQYVKDFGKEKGYNYILGNDGNGSLMYASEGDNLTKEIIQFINEKYKGAR